MDGRNVEEVGWGWGIEDGGWKGGMEVGHGSEQ